MMHASKSDFLATKSKYKPLILMLLCNKHFGDNLEVNIIEWKMLASDSFY